MLDGKKERRESDSSTRGKELKREDDASTSLSEPGSPIMQALSASTVVTPLESSSELLEAK